MRSVVICVEKYICKQSEVTKQKTPVKSWVKAILDDKENLS